MAPVAGRRKVLLRGKFAEEEVVVLDEGDDEGDEGSGQEGLGPYAASYYLRTPAYYFHII